jgi:hypothetical protein
MILFIGLVATCLGRTSTSAPSEVPEGTTEEAPPIEVHFCHFRVPEIVKSMNATFNVLYRFQIDSRGAPHGIERLRDDYVGIESVSDCLGQWVFGTQEAGREVIVMAHWKHAVGWTEMYIRGAGLNQRIVRSGDLYPYPGTGDANKDER